MANIPELKLICREEWAEVSGANQQLQEMFDFS